MNNEGVMWAIALVFVLMVLWRADHLVTRMLNTLDDRDKSLSKMANRALESAVNSAEERQRIAVKADADAAEIRVRELREPKIREIKPPVDEDGNVTISMGEDTVG